MIISTLQFQGVSMGLPQLAQAARRHHDAGQFELYEQVCRQILAWRPPHAETLHTLGVLALQADRHQLAIDLLSEAAVLDPGSAAYHNNLSVALFEAARFDEALAAVKRALALGTDYVDALNNLGRTLNRMGRRDEAIACLQRALEIDPRSVQTYNNAAYMYEREGALDRAEALLNKALAVQPRDALAHTYLATVYLLRGDLRRGLAEYEWRPDRATVKVQPEWDGSHLHGRAILLIAEQGFGDSIHMIRYAKKVVERGGRVGVACQQELVRLFQQNLPGSEVTHRLPNTSGYAVTYPLLSLPYLFNTTIETISAEVPYLRASDDAVAQWRPEIDARPGLKVGLAWAGSTVHVNDLHRSLRFAHLAPLLARPGATFYSLQHGTPAAEAVGADVVDRSALWQDFADTAGLIECLDLVITVDTAVAHLAGALGKPVWVMLPFAPDWRWMLNRADSPWYPTMRLFRQRTRGEWGPVVAEIAAALAAQCAP